MSKRTLSPQDQRILLAEAGGQCELEGCPEFIYEDMLTKQKFNFGEYAHIIGDSPDGPRGDLICRKSIVRIEIILCYFAPSITK